MKTKKLSKKISKQVHKSHLQKKPLFYQSVLSRKKELILVLLILIVALAISYYYISYQKNTNGFYGFPLDDPWIHLNFAKNLVEYNAYSYYKDEVITSGSTSPLYTFIAALLFLIIKNEFILSYLIGIAFLVLLVLFAYLLSKQVFNSVIFALIFSFLIALQPKLTLISVSGMETTMFIFMSIASFYFYRIEKLALTGIFLGLSLWTRPEGLTIILVLFFDAVLQKVYFKTEFGSIVFRKDNLLKLVLPLFVLSISYFAFNFTLDGHLLPNTYRAKINYYYDADRMYFIKRDIINYFSSDEFIAVWIFFFVNLIFCIYDLIKKRYNPFILFSFFVILFITVYIIQLPFAHRFGRYLMPVIPFYLISSIYGLKRFVELVHTKSKSDWYFALNGLVALFTIVTLLLSINQIPDDAKEIAMVSKYHYDRHIKIAEWLKKNTKETDIIATHDIGAIAFYSDRKIVDMVGLINPEVIEHLRDQNFSEFLKKYFIEKNVSYFVTIRNWFEAVNQKALYLPINEYEFMEVFEFIPERFHLMPLRSSYFNERAIFYIQNKDYQRALSFLQRSYQLDPNSSRTLFLMGNVYDFLGDYANAEKYLRRAIELYPEFTEAYYELARVSFIKKDLENTRYYLNKCLNYNPDFKPALEFMINLLENFDKNPEEAKKFRERLSVLN